MAYFGNNKVSYIRNYLLIPGRDLFASLQLRCRAFYSYSLHATTERELVNFQAKATHITTSTGQCSIQK
jgi:hypothetical protein